MIDKEVIQSATDKKYTDFSTAVKVEMQDKLANHEVISGYVAEVKDMTSLKSKFSEINTPIITSEE